MHFPVIGECLGWRTTDFEELYGDLGQWTMTKELAREVSCFYLSSHCEVWWIAESILNMSRSRADRTMSSWLLYFRNFIKFHTVSYIIWTPLWMKCASVAAILSNISANGDVLLLVFFFRWIFSASKGSKKPIDADTHGECIKSFQNARFFVEIKRLVLADDFSVCKLAYFSH